MKYNASNIPLVCMMTNSVCYKGTRPMDIKGILWHSTGANNPTLKRYVQPSPNDANYNELMQLLGKNSNGNDWNHSKEAVGVNAFIGKLANGEVTTVQTLPWNFTPWGCGVGSKGSCNNGWIQFEICEDALIDPLYFNKVYQEACELTAYLCKLYNINPKGCVNVNGIQVPTILCHNDSYKLGMGSGHADVTHWFPKFGKSMATVRNDVAELLEDNEMDVNKFGELMLEYRKTLQDNDCSSWSAEARDWAIKNKIISGSGNGNYMWQDQLSREQMVQMLFNFAKFLGKA